jgi:hypothetical protein
MFMPEFCVEENQEAGERITVSPSSPLLLLNMIESTSKLAQINLLLPTSHILVNCAGSNSFVTASCLSSGLSKQEICLF